MKYKLAMAFAVAAVMILSVIPAISDEADAYEVKDSESAVGYSVKDLSGDTLKKILPAEEQNKLAIDVLSQLVVEYSVYVVDHTEYYYDISEVTVTEYSSSQYIGGSISDKHHNRVGSYSESYKITFKATCNTAIPLQLFPNEYQYEPVIKDVGRNNLSQEGAVFEVSAYVENVITEHSKLDYAVNSSGDIFITHGWIKEYYKHEYKSDVKYTVNGKTTVYSSDIGGQNSARKDVTKDFGDVSLNDVTELTRELLETDVDQYGGLSWNKIKFNDVEDGYTTYSYNPVDDDDLHAYRNVSMFKTDIEAKYAFYAEDSSSTIAAFYGETVDESLRDDAKMKQFLSDNGTVKDTFSSVEKAADSYYHDLTFTDDLKQAGLVVAAAFGAFIVTVIVVVIVIALIKRKK